MNPIAVWAPLAQAVAVETAAGRRGMSRAGGGWWRANGMQLAHGDDYAFVLDGAAPALPDPRALWLPHGVHGPARALDHSRFRWSDTAFRARPLASGLVYELHVGTFSGGRGDGPGTFDGVAEHLDHLVALGVTHVELMPVATFPGRFNWGYDGVGLFAPHETYGGPEGLKRLVDRCHAAGIAVLLDVVYNHLGPEGNYLARFGPYFTRDFATRWGEAVNLSGADSDEVRRFFIDNALAWLRDYHVDGLRLDAVHALFDTSATHFLEELSDEVHRLAAVLGKPLVVIAESDLNDPRVVRPKEVGGYGMDAQWSDDLHHALHALLTGERAAYYADYGRIADVAKALRRTFVMDGRYSSHRRRRHGRPASGVPAHRFLGYLQNHDQVGNRARGERLTHLIEPRFARGAAALVHLGPFVPMVFQGEEWAASTPFLYFTDHADPQLREAVSGGRAREFAGLVGDRTGPDPQDASTFQRSRLDWSELGRAPHAAALEWHRSLVALRHSIPELNDPALEHTHVAFGDGDHWIRMDRGPITVACNFMPRAISLACPKEHSRALVLVSGEASLEGRGIQLGSGACAIMKRGE